MKKTWILLLTSILALLSACKNTDPVLDDESLATLKADYQRIINQCPDAAGYFVEAQYELNGRVCDMNAQDLRPVYVHYLCYWWAGEKGYLVSLDRDFITGAYTAAEKEEIDVPWAGDSHIPNFDGFISLEEAIHIVKKSSVNDPETVFVTLRHPVLPNGSPRYVFGGQQGREEHIQVDAKTGELYVLE